MKSHVLTRLGKRIKSLRMDLGFSQEQFADQIGVDRTYVSGVERGVRNPTIATLHVFAKGLRITLSQLLEGVE